MFKSWTQVLVIEKDFILGGRLNSEGESNNSWLINSIDELLNRKNVRVLTRTNLLKKGIRGNFLAIQRSFQKDNIEKTKESTMAKISAFAKVKSDLKDFQDIPDGLI